MMRIAIEKIVAGTHRRALKDLKALASSIEDVGLLNPITVRVDGKGYRLIAGYHRLEACKAIGWLEIDATVVDLNDLEAELAEIDENLCRHDLTVQDRALLNERKVNLLLALHPETQTAAGRPKANSDTVTGLHRKVANESGQSERGVKRDLQIARDIAPDVHETLRDTPVADSTTDLLTIARHPVEIQRVIAVKVAAGATVDGAVYSARKEALKASKSERDANGVASLPPVSDRYQLIHGDMKDVVATWPEHSVDCILTDPPYPREFVDLYLYLAQLSIRVLKPGGLLVMMCGQSYLPEIFERLSSITKADWGLEYRWTMAYLTPGGQAVQLFQRHVNTFWKPVLVYSNGPIASDSPWFGDVAKSSPNDNDKTLHKWGQSESGFVSLMNAVTVPGQVVMDPFMGAGTTGVVALGMDRRFIGIDVDADCVETARERIEGFINE